MIAWGSVSWKYVMQHGREIEREKEERSAWPIRFRTRVRTTLEAVTTAGGVGLALQMGACSS